MSLKSLLESKADMDTVLQEARQDTTSFLATITRKLKEFAEILKELHPEAHTSIRPSEYGHAIYLAVSDKADDLNEKGILTVLVHGSQAEFRTPYVKMLCFNETHINEALVLTYRSEEMAARLKIEASPFDEESLDDYYDEEPRTHYR
jgi:hypothetical protein